MSTPAVTNSPPTPLRSKHLPLIALLTAPLVGSCKSFKHFMYEGPGCDRWQQPDKVVDALGSTPGA